MFVTHDPSPIFPKAEIAETAHIKNVLLYGRSLQTLLSTY